MGPPRPTLTGQGSSQVSPSQPGVQEQDPSAGLQAAPWAQAQLSLQFRPHVPLGHGRAQSRPCHPEGNGQGCLLSVTRPHGFLPTPPAPYKTERPNHSSSGSWFSAHIPPSEPTRSPSVAVGSGGARSWLSLFLLQVDDPARTGHQRRWGPLWAQGGLGKLISGRGVWEQVVTACLPSDRFSPPPALCHGGEPCSCSQVGRQRETGRDGGAGAGEAPVSSPLSLL